MPRAVTNIGFVTGGDKDLPCRFIQLPALNGGAGIPRLFCALERSVAGGFHRLISLSVFFRNIPAAISDPGDIGIDIVISRHAGPEINQHPIAGVDGRGILRGDFKVRIPAMPIDGDNRRIDRLQPIDSELIENELLHLEFVNVLVRFKPTADQIECAAHRFSGDIAGAQVGAERIRRPAGDRQLNQVGG